MRHVSDIIGHDAARAGSVLIRLIISNAARCMDEKLRILNGLEWGTCDCLACRHEPIRDEWGRTAQEIAARPREEGT